MDADAAACLFSSCAAVDLELVATLDEVAAAAVGLTAVSMGVTVTLNSIKAPANDSALPLRQGPVYVEFSGTIYAFSGFGVFPT